jgi:nitroreductase
MEVADAIHTRRANRVFDPRPIEEDKIRALVEVMRLAPSCNNHQPWRAIFCTGEALGRVKGALNKGNVWATPAPLIVVIATKPADDCRLGEGRDYYKFSCGLAVGQMLLRAVDLGLTAHPIAGYDPVKAREALSIPNDYVVLTFVICGYQGTDESLLSDKQKLEQRERPPRKPVEENFFRDGWGRPFA